MNIRLTRKNFTEEAGLQPAFEKRVRCGQAKEKNEDITAPWKTSHRWNVTGTVCSVFKNI